MRAVAVEVDEISTMVFSEERSGCPFCTAPVVVFDPLISAVVLKQGYFIFVGDSLSYVRGH